VYFKKKFKESSVYLLMFFFF